MPGARKTQPHAPPKAPPNTPPNTPPKAAGIWLDHLRRLYDAPHYALAVSGGSDSMALVALAAHCQNLSGPSDQTGFSVPRFTVLTVDHGLRPEAKAETRLVSRQARALGLKVKVLTVNDKLSFGGVQAAARDARYRLMEDYCHAQGITALVTAHHAQDQAETMLMRLARGSDLAGLSCIPPISVRGQLVVIRPFLEHMPDDMAAICHAAGLSVVSDPSNHDTRFERVRWRNALPRLAEWGLTASMLGQSAARLRRVHDDLTKLAHDYLRQWQAILPMGVVRLPRAEFVALPQTIQRRLLTDCFVWLGGANHPPRQRSMDAVLALSAASHSSGRTLAGVDLRIRRQDIVLGREAAAAQLLPALTVKRQMSMIWDGRYRLEIARKHRGNQIAALGREGLKALKAQGFVSDPAIPTRFYASVPAIFEGSQLVSCPHLLADQQAQAGLISPFATK